MAKMKEAQLEQEEFMENLQKFVLCGHEVLNAIEKMALFSMQGTRGTKAENETKGAVSATAAGNEAGGSATAAAAEDGTNPMTSEKSPAKGANSERGASGERPASPEDSGKQADVPREATLEEVRGMLAEKSRRGFRAEVKALLTAHGAEKLSEIRDPAELGRLLEEAGRIGVT